MTNQPATPKTPGSDKLPGFLLKIYPDRELYVHDGKVFEQVPNFPAFVQVGEVVCPLPSSQS